MALSDFIYLFLVLRPIKTPPPPPPPICNIICSVRSIISLGSAPSATTWNGRLTSSLPRVRFFHRDENERLGLLASEDEDEASTVSGYSTNTTLPLGMK